ncbi:MAG: LD-carboxypeptidase [Desulfobacterales bacterium]|nr:LD-carboxypeptidase [Desulfobacterales bacterium]
MTFKCPVFLQPGDRVGIVAPASPFDRDRLNRGMEVLCQMGLEPVFTDRVFHKNRYFAGMHPERASDIHEFFENPDIRALWAVRGGYGSLRLLSELDYSAMAEAPKIFIGSSDITALLVTLYRRCRMVTFHGPMVTSLAEADADTIRGLNRVLFGFKPLKIEAVQGGVIQEGSASGPVIGGNLATLCHLLATPFEPDFSGCILFVEDTGEKPYRIDRMLTQMKLAGCFDSIKALIAGSFENCGPPEEVEKIFADLFAGSHFPVVTGFPAGHCMPNMTLPIGVMASLDSSSGSLTYHGPAVSSFSDKKGSGGQ